MATVSLTANWTQIAAAGATVDVTMMGGSNAVLLTASTTPAANADGVVLNGFNTHRLWTLSQNLYARSSYETSVIQVLSGLSGFDTSTLAKDASIQSLLTAIGTPMQAGGAVVANIGTTNGLATDATMQAIKTLLGGTLNVQGITNSAAMATKIITGQVKIATTGTAVALPANALQNGVLVKAKATNAIQTALFTGAVGPASVSTLFDGTGTGYALAPGEAANFSVANTNLVYVNGMAGDVFSYVGN